MIRTLLALVAMTAVATAAPKRPTEEEAVVTAQAWLQVANFVGGDVSVTSDEMTALHALTRLPFAGIALDPEGGCKAEGTRTKYALAVALSCLRRFVRGSDVNAADKDDIKRLAGPLRAYRGRMTTLAKSATLVHHHEECTGQGSDLVLAVGYDKGKPKVVAMFWQLVLCRD